MSAPQPAPAGTPEISVSGTADILALTPYLVGYPPEEQLVTSIIEHHRIACTAAIPITPDGRIPSLHAVVRSLAEFSSPLLFLSAWSTDEERADEALARAESGLGPHRVLDSVVVAAGRWRSRGSANRSGAVASLASSPVAVQAVVAGMARAGSRSEAVAVVAGPGARRRDVLAQRHRAAEARLLARGPDERAERALELQWLCLQRGDATPEELSELACLALDDEVVGHLWLSLSQELSAPGQELWLRVVAQAPTPWAAGALQMAGFASWLDGNGCLLGAAVERLLRLGATSRWTSALHHLHDRGVPPGAWDRVRGDPGAGQPLPW